MDKMHRSAELILGKGSWLMFMPTSGAIKLLRGILNSILDDG
jgi:hypothetical protein